VRPSLACASVALTPFRNCHRSPRFLGPANRLACIAVTYWDASHYDTDLGCQPTAQTSKPDRHRRKNRYVKKGCLSCQPTALLAFAPLRGRPSAGRVSFTGGKADGKKSQWDEPRSDATAAHAIGGRIWRK